MTIVELAARIDAHVKRMQLNRDLDMNDAGAYKVHGAVRVEYHPQEKWDLLGRREAAEYLAWLDAGNVGRHWEIVGDM